jgi:hypothetical protein
MGSSRTMLLHLESPEIDELAEEHISWSELYGVGPQDIRVSHERACRNRGSAI